MFKNSKKVKEIVLEGRSKAGSEGEEEESPGIAFKKKELPFSVKGKSRSRATKERRKWAYLVQPEPPFVARLLFFVWCTFPLLGGSPNFFVTLILTCSMIQVFSQ